MAISYRRSITAGAAGRIFDHLEAKFGEGSVFMDIDRIRPGRDFLEEIRAAISRSNALLVLVGPEWETLSGEDGARRLDDPQDIVRMEIRLALESGTPVIPVLVHGASMPEPQRLPDDIRSLSWHQAVHLHDDRFRSDVTRLVEMLESLGPRDKSGPQAPTAMLAWILTLGVILVGILGVLIGLFSGL